MTIATRIATVAAALLALVLSVAGVADAATGTLGSHGASASSGSCSRRATSRCRAKSVSASRPRRKPSSVSFASCAARVVLCSPFETRDTWGRPRTRPHVDAARERRRILRKYAAIGLGTLAATGDPHEAHHPFRS